jgi:hypothetical protein
MLHAARGSAARQPQFRTTPDATAPARPRLLNPPPAPILIASPLLEIELTHSQQTRKHFLIASFSATFGGSAAGNIAAVHDEGAYRLAQTAGSPGPRRIAVAFCPSTRANHAIAQDKISLCEMVEAGGVEPPSEKPCNTKPTCLSRSVGFAASAQNRQDALTTSPMISPPHYGPKRDGQPTV